jgi:hypothetical protein
MVIEAVDEEAAKFLMCVHTENVKKTTLVDINEFTAVPFEPEKGSCRAYTFPGPGSTRMG